MRAGQAATTLGSSPNRVFKHQLPTRRQDLEFSEIFLRIQKAIGLTLLSSESSFKKAYYALQASQP